MLSIVLRKALSSIHDSKFRTWIALERELAYAIPPPPRGPTLELIEFDNGVPCLSSINLINPRANCGSWSRRIEKGNVCVVAYLNEIPVFYEWVFRNDTGRSVHLNKVTDMHIDVEIPTCSAYFWDAWTNEHLRGQGIHGVVTVSLCNSLKLSGYKSCIALVDSLNWSSIKSFRRIGFTQVARATHLRVLGFDAICGHVRLQ